MAPCVAEVWAWQQLVCACVCVVTYKEMHGEGCVILRSRECVPGCEGECVVRCVW